MKPVHPILVHFPLALLPVSVLGDAVGVFAGIEALSQTGVWTMLAAGASSEVTAAAGWHNMTRVKSSWRT